MNNDLILKAVFVFLASFISDILWVFYIRRTSQGKALTSAIFSSSIIFIGGFIIVSYVENKWLLIPAALGTFCGNYLSVKLDSKKQ